MLSEKNTIKKKKRGNLKKILIGFCVCSFAPFIIMFCLFLSDFLLEFYGGYYLPKSEPAVTYGEFPCRVTYEINGEEKVLEDVIICEFEKDYLNRKKEESNWKKHLKSGKESLTLLDLGPYGERIEDGTKITTLFFDYGNAEYYMGDKTSNLKAPQGFDIVKYSYERKSYQNSISCSTGIFSDEEAFEKYGIRIISFECAPPIENKFE